MHIVISVPVIQPILYSTCSTSCTYCEADFLSGSAAPARTGYCSQRSILGECIADRQWRGDATYKNNRFWDGYHESKVWTCVVRGISDFVLSVIVILLQIFLLGFVNRRRPVGL